MARIVTTSARPESARRSRWRCQRSSPRKRAAADLPSKRRLSPFLDRLVFTTEQCNQAQPAMRNVTAP
jgi:hypothetical protein